MLALSSMWWWLTPASFVLGGGCLCVPSSLLVERGAMYLEVCLNPQKEFKKAHLQLKGNGVPDTYNMSIFQKGRRWAHHHQKKSARNLLSRLTYAKTNSVYFIAEKTGIPPKERRTVFYFTYQSASHAFLLGVLVNAAHASAWGEIRTCFVPLWFHVERPQLRPRNRETKNETKPIKLNNGRPYFQLNQS